VLGLVGIILRGGELVAEKASRFGLCMRDQRFLLREIELQFVTQKRFDSCFDLLRFRSWSGVATEPVIGIAHVVKPPELGVIGLNRGQALGGLAQFSCLVFLASFP